MSTSITEDTPDKSPSALKGISELYSSAPKGVGGRKLNNVPKYIAIGAGACVIIALCYAIIARGASNANQKTKAAKEQPVSTAALPSDLNQPPAALPTSEAAVNQISPETIDPNLHGAPVVPPPQAQPNYTTQPSYAPMPTQMYQQAANMVTNAKPAYPYAEAWQRYRQAQAQANAGRGNAFTSALNAASGVKFDSGSSSAGSGGSRMSGGTQAAPYIPNSEDASFNGQQSKLAFMNQRNSASNYSGTYRTPALTNYEVKAGTIIPSIMISGINSDLPGQIIAQVSQNVYDTKTGKYLLIPKGSRLIGTYDSGVTMGQTRVLIAWQRIIFPDTSSIDLPMMPGSDQAGYAGFKDKVNNHYGKIFGSTAIMSLLSAGAQLSQPQSVNGENVSSGQTAAGAIGQEMASAGRSVIERNIRIQPTLEVRPGYRFNVQVTKDLILPPNKR